ncbi:MAG TPA: hypothetical protein VM733_00915 [Thermoanaerobaculia bacterium]|nr:hypothetical protein [Thermoanaerobaculia bacterium]
MSTAVYVPIARCPMVRPIALPAEHDGWGFLGEPVAPSSPSPPSSDF